MYQAGLVLEGGGMKGIYTAGVLDFFLENGKNEYKSKLSQNHKDLFYAHLTISKFIGASAVPVTPLTPLSLPP